MSDDHSTYVAVGGALGGSLLTFLGQWVNGLFNRKQTLTQSIDERLKVLMTGYEKRIEDLTDQVNEQSKQLAGQEAHIGNLTEHILLLTKTLSQNGLVVPPPPQSEFHNPVM